MKYPIIVHKDPESDYGVTFPDIPGCFSAGENLDEALKNAQEAALTHIEGLLMDQEPVPMPSTLEKVQSKYKEKDIIWALVQVDLSRLADKSKRVNISMPEKLLMKIDHYARKNNETRSGFLAHAALEYMGKRGKTAA